MKKTVYAAITASITFILAACQGDRGCTVLAQTAAGSTAQETSAVVAEGSDGWVAAAPAETLELKQEKKLRIRVRAGEEEIVFELNDSIAAKSLYEQLPLIADMENFGDNEKIFYPAEKLDITDTPHANSGAGTLAYYAPWGNVVLFFGDYSPNGQLYELGTAVSGSDEIGGLSGTLEVERVQTNQ